MRALVVAAILLVLAVFTRDASAHAVGLSTGEYTAHGSLLTTKLAFARGEVASLVPTLDKNSDGHITASEVDGAHDLITAKILQRIHVTQLKADCTPKLDDAGLTENDGILIGAHYACPKENEAFQVELLILDDLARGHRHVARTVSGSNVHDEVLFGDQRTLTIAPAAGSDASNPDEVKKNSSTVKPGFWGFFLMGIEHILTGYDHLVFVFGLILIRARMKSLLAIISAFTLAHSITLGLATLGIWTPSPRVIEPAIALSIAYVGVDNLWRPNPEKRWRITFPFGLIHGFGFAGALAEIGLPRASIPVALVSFNLGVEAGQLAVLAVLLPVVMGLRKTSFFDPMGVRVLSVVIVIAGLVWFIARLH
jgi:hydrogenase/urease accessory protein HupE